MRRAEDRFPDRAAVVVAAAVTAVVTYALVVLGGAVRATGSGMGCPDWPLCKGQFGPLSDSRALWEQSHRYVVVLLTVLVVVTAGLAWRHRTRRPELTWLLGGAVLTLMVQSLVGAITVWTGNAPVTVAVHLALGLILLATLVAAAARAASPHPVDPGAPRDRLAWTVVVATFVVVLSGAAVANTAAHHACSSWPLCTGQTAGRGLIALQLVHRGIVAIAAVALLLLAVRCWRRRADRFLGTLLLALLGGQVAVGWLVATRHESWVVESLHLALASAVWGVVIATVVRRPLITVRLEPVTAWQSLSTPARR